MRILFLSGWFPYPPDNGSKIRIYNLLRALARRHEITLLTFSDGQKETHLDGLPDYCQVTGIVRRESFQPRRLRALLGFLSSAPRSLVDTYRPEMARLVQQEFGRREYNVAIASEFSTAPYLANVKTASKVFEDVETTVIREGFTQASNHLARLRRWLTWTKARRYLGRLVPQFAACTVVSERERSNLREAAPEYDRVEIIPNGVDADWLRPSEVQVQPSTLVFNGALTYSANYDAMNYFLTDIWPQIKAMEPTASLKITGPTDGVALQKLALGDGVTLTGYLDDIRPVVAGAWACVVPLQIGAGTRVKILEAMALGTPVITTTKGAEGLDVTPKAEILIADDPAQFAAQTVRLLRDPDLRRRLVENGRRLVEEKYNWRVIGEKFNHLVESVVGGRSSRTC